MFDRGLQKNSDSSFSNQLIFVHKMDTSYKRRIQKEIKLQIRTDAKPKQNTRIAFLYADTLYYFGLLET